MIKFVQTLTEETHQLGINNNLTCIKIYATFFEYMFEFDPLKSAINSDKHGIDFSQGQKLWADPNLIVLSSKYQDEQRFLAIGSISGINWTAIFTE